MWLLAQLVDEIPVAPVLPVWQSALLEIGASFVSFAYFAFLIWMLIHCFRTEPDRQFWIWILIIAPGVGPVAYFFLRYLPSKEFPAPAFLRRWTRARTLTRLETAAIQIGNPHQYVQWGDALREVGRLDQARQAYESAMKKEPKNLPALWGAARVAISQKRAADVRQLTQDILSVDEQYKFGDVSLAYARSLDELGETQLARAQLENHIKRWRHPEALYLAAKLSADQGDVFAARQYLQGMLLDINGSPAVIARKFGRWKSRARQMLRKLP